MDKVSFRISRYTVCLFAPDVCCDSIVYIHEDEQTAEEIAKSISGKTALAVIGGINWNNDLSPWKGDKVFAKGDDFSGGGEKYLEELAGLIIPETEKGLKVKKRYICGYSLGGLFALWALYNTAAFNGGASVSGSMWYDGFTEYALGKDFLRVPEKFYFSLGDKEKNTKNPRMAVVEAATEKIYRHIKNKNIKTVFDINHGGHFTDAEKRMIKAINWLEEQT